MSMDGMEYLFCPHLGLLRITMGTYGLHPQTRVFFMVQLWVVTSGRNVHTEVYIGFYLIIVLLITAFMTKAIDIGVLACHTKMVV